MKLTVQSIRAQFAIAVKAEQFDKKPEKLIRNMKLQKKHGSISTSC